MLLFRLTLDYITEMCKWDFSRQMRTRVQYLTKMHPLRYYFTANHLNSGLLHRNVQLGLLQVNANVGLIFDQNAPNRLLFHGKSPKLRTASHKCAIGIAVDKCE